MEKQARLYAEEQLQEAKMALQAERQAKGELHAQLKAKMQEIAELYQQAKQDHEQEKQQGLVLQQQLEQVRCRLCMAEWVGRVTAAVTTARGDCQALACGAQSSRSCSL